MFLRRKQSGQRVYLQVVENRWEEGRSRQRVIATLGRLDTLLASGELDALVRSAARFSEALLVLDAHGAGETPVASSERVGPALIPGAHAKDPAPLRVKEVNVEGRSSSGLPQRGPEAQGRGRP
jgi:hypothetical protein